MTPTDFIFFWFFIYIYIYIYMYPTDWFHQKKNQEKTKWQVKGKWPWLSLYFFWFYIYIYTLYKGEWTTYVDFNPLLTWYIYIYIYIYVCIPQTDFITRKILARQKKILTLTKKSFMGYNVGKKNPAFTVVCQETNTVTRGLGKKILTQTISPTLLHHLVCCDFFLKKFRFYQ